MPKTGLTPREWQRRLQDYANGRFEFGRGQRPPPSSKWGPKVVRIEQCPRHRGATRNVFGQTISCVCGYHETRGAPSTSSTSRDPGSTETVQRLRRPVIVVRDYNCA